MTTDEEDNYQKQSTPEKTSPKQQIKDNNNVKFTLLFFYLIVNIYLACNAKFYSFEI
jgi:hypothetical protein